MRCLTDVELQALADGEAGEMTAVHLAGCGRCRDRVEEIRRRIADITALVDRAGDMPPAVEARVRQAVTSGRGVRGATSLRGPLPAGSWRRAALASALATAAVIAVVFGALPRFGAPTTLSASEVLGRSLQTLQTMSSTHGIERLEYDLFVEGLTHGTWRVEQLIDYERPTRYRIAAYEADGALHAAMSQDPLRRRRSQLVRVDDRNYIVTVGSIRNPILSLPQMVQALVETAITTMQATSDQKLAVLDGPGGQQYVIEIPPAAPRSAVSTLELYRARTVVDGADFRIREFEAAGTLLRVPFLVSFKLIQRTVRPAADVPASEFDIQPGPGDVVLEGLPADEPAGELLNTILRELAKTRTF